MLTLSKSQYKDLCHDCAGQMMQGSGEGLPDTIPDFTGTNIQFWVSDPALEGGGFMDTLSNTWDKVKKFVTESPLAQQVVKKGIDEGRKIARGVADTAVKAGVEYLPESFRGPVEGLAEQALNKLESSAAKKAESAILDKTPTAAPATTTTPAAATQSKSGKKRRRMDGGAFGEISLHSGSFVTAPAFDPSMMPSGSTSVSAVNSISARAY
jgi:hypothetical protein